MTIAARAHAERNRIGHRSYRVATYEGGSENSPGDCFPDHWPVLEAGEHVLDLVAQAIERRVVRDRDLATGPGRDLRRNPQLDQRVAEPIGVVAPVCQQSTRLRDGVQQRPRPDLVRGLARREEHVDRATLCIGQDVQFRVQPAPLRDELIPRINSSSPSHPPDQTSAPAS